MIVHALQRPVRTGGERRSKARVTIDNGLNRGPQRLHVESAFYPHCPRDVVDGTIRINLPLKPQTPLTMRERVFRLRFGSRDERQSPARLTVCTFEHRRREFFDCRDAQQFTGPQRHSGLFFD